jgi:50S ribosomal subunit-associated GTPase HflX
MEAVEKILLELGLEEIPRFLVFSKEDKLDQEEVRALCKRYGAVSISALRPEGLEIFFQALKKKLWEIHSLAKESDGDRTLGN